VFYPPLLRNKKKRSKKKDCETLCVLCGLRGKFSLVLSFDKIASPNEDLGLALTLLSIG